MDGWSRSIRRRSEINGREELGDVGVLLAYSGGLGSVAHSPFWDGIVIRITFLSLAW